MWCQLPCSAGERVGCERLFLYITLGSIEIVSANLIIFVLNRTSVFAVDIGARVLCF